MSGSKVDADYGTVFGEKFQRHILAVMCRVPSFALRYRTALDHTYFVDKTHRALAKAVLSVLDQDRKLPSFPTLLEVTRPLVGADEIEHVENALDRLEEEDVSDADTVARKTVEFGKQQALVNAVLQSAEKLEKGDRAIKPLIDNALMVGEDLLEIGVDFKGDAADRRVWYTDPDQAVTGLRTGITHLDTVLNGGLGRGELGVVLAPPGRGKTTTLINIGYGALTDVGHLNVVHYSLEMNRKRITMRYDDRMMGARVKYKKSDPHLYAEEVLARSQMLSGRLFVNGYSTRAAGASTIRAHLTLLQSRGFKPDVIVVDYADIMRPERRMGEMRHEQAGIYEDLRHIAGDFDAAVWTGSQASKSAMDKETITIADFAEAFEKAAICDVAIAVCQTDDERIDNRARLFTAKIRNAEDGRTVECEIWRDRCLLRSVGILDAAGTRIVGDVDESVQQTKTTYKAGNKSTVKSLKAEVGLVAPEKQKFAKKKKK
jgi:RecA/RadA recombinase